MADDCAYCASVGPEVGTTYQGWSEMNQGVVDMLTFESSGESRQGRAWFSNDRAFAEWDYDDLDESGCVTVIRGIDVIHIVDNKIQSIDAYRKTLK